VPRLKLKKISSQNNLLKKGFVTMSVTNEFFSVKGWRFLKMDIFKNVQNPKPKRLFEKSLLPKNFDKNIDFIYYEL
jgi:hypothetical protein